MSDSNRSRSDKEEIDSYDQQQEEESDRQFGEKKTSVKFADKELVFGEDSEEQRNEPIRNVASILKTANVVDEVKPKKPTHTDAQQITDDEDEEEPFYSQKRAVQDRIFMARICEMGGRSEDQLQFMIDALVRKETHCIKDLTVP